MATKHNDECLEKVADAEPIFVLRAKDALAPEIVEAWAEAAQDELGPDHPKVEEARQHAMVMRQWGEENGARFPG